MDRAFSPLSFLSSSFLGLKPQAIMECAPAQGMLSGLKFLTPKQTDFRKLYDFYKNEKFNQKKISLNLVSETFI